MQTYKLHVNGFVSSPEYDVSGLMAPKDKVSNVEFDRVSITEFTGKGRALTATQRRIELVH